MTSPASRLFAQRAALYHHLDRHLAPQTRFFGAALYYEDRQRIGEALIEQLGREP